ncbi:uncharacterized protein LOC123883641 isoform X2 [Trifolium pratense]|uniref:uncharacterized protein LOC123883641 isoform X1 n=1 Tax=Trifolium pratense TaxID=57577 RepID=UPI001E6940FF|nr:uncharacterized protein LOC123883641 isoform X1 [Trifolium pratense]XP_045788495.1 uncharacterized protein LOC123883641 isoform X2 [Trifolium pratense]
MKRKQVEKSKVVDAPTFSLGLTQSDDSKASSSRPSRQLKGKIEQTKANEKKQYKKTVHQQNDEGSSDDGEKVKGKKRKEVTEPDQRLRHKMSIPKVYILMQSVNTKKFKKKIVEELNQFGFGGMLHICNWTRIHTFFVDWIVNNFEKDHMWIRLRNTEVLELKQDDVHRVYELPMVGKKINTDLCSDAAINRLRRELGLTENSSPFVKVVELERVLNTTEKATAWVKGAICYIIHNLLCPTNHSDVSLQYAHILVDAATALSHNWCSHILEYMKEGLQSPGVANPLADFHFLMINYLDKMGKRSPFLTGKYKHPSLRDWDVKMANQDLQKVYDVMGLENGLTAGVTRLNATNEGPVVLGFDADTCPLSKGDKKEEKSDEMEEEKNDEKKDKKGDEEKYEEKDEKKDEANETKDVGCGVDKKNDEHPSSEEEEFDVDMEFFDAPEGSRSKKEDPMKEQKDPVEEQQDIIEPTPLRIVLPDQIIDLGQEVTTKPKRRKNQVMEDRTYLDRRRAVKKSKYLTSPYDDAVYESTASKLQKDVSTFAWSTALDKSEILYCSGFHKFSLQRCDLWTLNKDEWVDCFVVNSWVNCLNWDQRNGVMRRLVTRYVNHENLERPGALEMDQASAFESFVNKLKWFKYLNWKKIDPTKLEYIMTPALIGNPGSHYVCFVVNFKSCTFQFLNSINGERFLVKSGEPTTYKKMFDVWFKEVEAFVIELYKHWKLTIPFDFSKFKWETPKMPSQPDKDNCGVFCMKFLAEWEGDSKTSMDSFKNWNKLKKQDKVAKLMDLRIEICSTLLTHSSNSKVEYVVNQAASYYEEMAQKLQHDV